MAQNYTRQSTFADGDTITAALFNDEYNQLVNTFNYSSTDSAVTGHRHDGTAGEGGNIYRIGDLNFLNKIEADSANNRWGVFVEVGGSAVEQVRIQDGAVVPVTNNDVDLGSASFQFKDLYVDGTANIDSLVADAVGIGTSSPAAPLHIQGSAGASGASTNVSADEFFIDNDGTTGITIGSSTTGQGWLAFADSNVALRGGVYYDHSSDYMAFRVSSEEKVRITSSGNLLVGQSTSTNPGAGNTIVGAAVNGFGLASFSRDGNLVGTFNRNTSDGSLVGFYKDGAQVGSISVTGSATAYNTSSDARLKENIADAESSSERIDAIQVRQFDWKVDGSHQDYGMIAQELMTVAPEAVSGDPESDEMMGVDYSKLVPMMLKEIQSLRARVAALEA